MFRLRTKQRITSIMITLMFICSFLQVFEPVKAVSIESSTLSAKVDSDDLQIYVDEATNTLVLENDYVQWNFSSTSTFVFKSMKLKELNLTFTKSVSNAFENIKVNGTVVYPVVKTYTINQESVDIVLNGSNVLHYISLSLYRYFLVINSTKFSYVGSSYANITSSTLLFDMQPNMTGTVYSTYYDANKHITNSTGNYGFIVTNGTLSIVSLTLLGAGFSLSYAESTTKLKFATIFIYVPQGCAIPSGESIEPLHTVIGGVIPGNWKKAWLETRRAANEIVNPIWQPMDFLTHIGLSAYSPSEAQEILRKYVANMSSYGFRLVSIDNGWQYYYGDWNESRLNLAEITALAHQKYMLISLWWEPDNVETSSKIYSGAPEWLVHNKTGGITIVNNKARLSLAREEAFNFLIYCLQVHNQWGFDYSRGGGALHGAVDYISSTKVYPTAYFIWKFMNNASTIMPLFDYRWYFTEHAGLLRWQVPEFGDPISDYSKRSVEDYAARVYFCHLLYGFQGIMLIGYVSATTTADYIKYAFNTSLGLGAGMELGWIISFYKYRDIVDYGKYCAIYHHIKSKHVFPLYFDSYGYGTWLNDSKTLTLFANNTVTRTVDLSGFTELEDAKIYIVYDWFRNRIVMRKTGAELKASQLTFNLSANTTIVYQFIEDKGTPQVIGVTNRANFNKTSETFTDQRLHVVLEGPSGVTGTTVIYCPYDPILVFENGELKTTNYTWNPGTKLLTVNVTFSSPVKLDIYFAIPKLESYDVKGEFLGYVFPGTQTVELNLQLYSEAPQVSQDTRIILEVYNMDGALIYTTAKRETLTQEIKTVTFNIPDLEPGTYPIKITLENPDTGEVLNTYSFILKVTYPWWLWLTAIVTVIAITTITVKKKHRHILSLKF